MTRIVQITDTHLFGDREKDLMGVKTRNSFEAVVDLIRSNPKQPDLILLTGDLTQDHSPESYAHLIDVMKVFSAPIYFIPGNHDDIPVMNRVFASSGFQKEKNILFDGWQCILLNSQKTHHPEGFLEQTELDFLEACLAAHPERRALVVTHHHSVSVGCTWLDKINLTNADAFWGLLSRYANVKMVLSGHVHQEYAGDYNGVPCYSTPSTCVQFKRHSTDFSLEELAPGYRWIELHSDGRIETAVQRAEKYIGVFNSQVGGRYAD